LLLDTERPGHEFQPLETHANATGNLSQLPFATVQVQLGYSVARGFKTTQLGDW
jgi:hypothetical protein